MKLEFLGFMASSLASIPNAKRVDWTVVRAAVRRTAKELVKL
jgi:hypothetical protein